jgi:hypothetical protein
MMTKLTIKRTAKICKLNPRTVRRWEKKEWIVISDEGGRKIVNCLSLRDFLKKSEKPIPLELEFGLVVFVITRKTNRSPEWREITYQYHGESTVKFRVVHLCPEEVPEVKDAWEIHNFLLDLDNVEGTDITELQKMASKWWRREQQKASPGEIYASVYPEVPAEISMPGIQMYPLRQEFRGSAWEQQVEEFAILMARNAAGGG